jgi:hypothetical protein
MTDAVQPTTPEAATARLSELQSSPDWRAKVDAQDPASFAEFRSLTTTVAGGIAAVAEANAATNNAKLVADFLAGPLPAGFPELSTPEGAELAQILKGEKQITPDLHQRIKSKLDSMISDSGWRARFDAKDERALREFQLSTVLLTADISEKAK